MAMRWEDEPWLKLYTRETPTTASWEWQAHAVWPQIMKRLDGAGLLHLGRRGAAGLAKLIRFPLEVVEAGLTDLVADGTVTIADGVLFAPNFLEAQRARTSDKQRKHEQRRRDRDAAVSNLSDSAESPSHDVTPRPNPSRIEEKREEEKRSEEKRHPDPAAPASGGGQPRKKPEPSPEAEACARHLLEAIRSHTPDHTEKHVRSWARDLDLAIREDKRTPDQLRKAADYAHRTGRIFLRANILSGRSLRAWFERLRIEATQQRAGASQQRRGGGLSPEQIEAFAAHARAQEGDANGED